MSAEFDPKLKEQLQRRKAERKAQSTKEQRKNALRKYLREHGLKNVDDDPRLVRIKHMQR